MTADSRTVILSDIVYRFFLNLKNRIMNCNNETITKPKLVNNNNIRYFKTEYYTIVSKKVLLHNNTLGNFPSRDFVINSIKNLNNNELVRIEQTVEITLKEYNKLMLLFDDGQMN